MSIKQKPNTIEVFAKKVHLKMDLLSLQWRIPWLQKPHGRRVKFRSKTRFFEENIFFVLSYLPMNSHLFFLHDNYGEPTFRQAFCCFCKKQKK
jgi:hypothetical protein